MTGLSHLLLQQISCAVISGHPSLTSAGRAHLLPRAGCQLFFLPLVGTALSPNRPCSLPNRPPISPPRSGRPTCSFHHRHPALQRVTSAAEDPETGSISLLPSASTPHSNNLPLQNLDFPVFETLRNAIIVLQDIGALTQDEKLTELGEKLGALPTTSKMFLFSILMNCLEPTLTLA